MKKEKKNTTSLHARTRGTTTNNCSFFMESNTNADTIQVAIETLRKINISSPALF